MKRTITLIACAAVCCAMTVSCKNTKTVEPTQEEIQTQKVALADSVLAQIDAFASEYITSYENGVRFRTFELTETEKLVKPDYLLDLNEANTLVTKSQKVNALAIYIVEYGVRKIYGIPLEDAKEAIVKLAVEVNFPFDTDQYEANAPLSERIKAEYMECKERGELAYFWQFQYAILVETGYIIANNIDLFFGKISEAEVMASNRAWIDVINAIEELAKYDEEMSELNTFISKHRIAKTQEQLITLYSNWETSKQTHITNKDKIIARRNALLQ